MAAEWKTETRTTTADRRWLRLTSAGATVYVPAANVLIVRAVGDSAAAGGARLDTLGGGFIRADQSPEAVMAALGVEVVDVAGGAP